jgi:hypothetical protein
MERINTVCRELLKNAGFVLKKRSWYRSFPEIMQMINFQKSAYSNLFYVNVCLTLQEFCGGKFESVGHYPFTIRAEDCMTSNTDILKSFDFENTSMSEDERTENILNAVSECVRFLDASASIQKFADKVTHDKHLKNYVQARLMPYMEHLGMQ